MSVGSKIKGILRGRPGDFPDWLIAGPARRPLPVALARRGPIVIAGLFRTASGIGQSARACADAFAALGIESVNVDLSSVFRQEDMQAEHPLSRMPTNAFGTLILSLNAPETIFALKALRLFWPRRWRVVGQWVWELDRALPVFGQTSKYFTEIWAPSAFSAAAIAPSVDVPVKIVPYFSKIFQKTSSQKEMSCN